MEIRNKFVSRIVAACTLLLAASSCGLPKDYLYFEDVKPGDVISSDERVDVRLKPGDKIMVIVTAPEPKLAEQFNINLSAAGGSGSNYYMYSGGGQNVGNNPNALTIDPQGNVRIPVLGNVYVAGLTRLEAAKTIESELIRQDYIKNPVVVVTFVTECVYFLGEIQQGKLEFQKDRMSIVEAVSLQGGLPPTAVRTNVLVLREQPDGSQKAYEVDFTDLAKMAQSPAYYLQQNDVIYVKPNDIAQRNTTLHGNQFYTYNFWIGFLPTIVGLGTLIMSTFALIKK